MRLAGRRILVTGGGSGIGRAIAMAYHEHGACVTILERSPERASEVREVVGGDIDVIVGDATDSDALANAVQHAAQSVGLDNLTCCVGIHDRYASLRSLTSSQVVSAADEIYRVNVVSTLLAVHAALDELQRVAGSITLTLSESAFHPIGGGVLYGSTKWALRGVVSHLAADLAPKIRVNGVAPGGTAGTRFGGLTSLGQTQTASQVEGRDQVIASGTVLGVTPRPEDHAGAYVYLADPVAARVTTGVVINTDAGRKH